MRIFTEKDREGIDIAFRTFLTCLTGKRFRKDSMSEITSLAFANGITVDELFNPLNLSLVLSSDNDIVENYSSPQVARAYVEALINRVIPVRTLNADDGSIDENLNVLSETFHAFYCTICPKGGTWNTHNAKMHLRHAILASNLQFLMSEEHILEAMKDTGKETEMTCFQYLQHIASMEEIMDTPELLTEEQKERKKLEEALLDEVPFEEPSEEEDEGLKMKEEEEYENVPKLKLDGSATNDIDDSIFFEPSFETEEIEDIHHSGFLSLVNPREYKRDSILACVMGLTIDEIASFATAMERVDTLEMFIDNLTDGKFDTKKDLSLRGIHQHLNAELTSAFITCVLGQGFPMDEDMASQYDILERNWDLRDAETRENQKVKDLILRYGDDDPDLLNYMKKNL